MTSAIQHGLKRLLDLTVALGMLILSAPIFLAACIAIPLTSRGPILFQQTRCSKSERPFTILKFRTMHVNAEAATGPTWVAEQDNRITPLGHFLRKTHVDELPQLLNIIKGDMSFVGPRPERPCFVEQFHAQGVPGYERRHDVIPGITGFAQMRNSNPSLDQINEKTADDLWYIDHWSLALDAKLVAQTATYFFKSLGKLLRPKSKQPVPVPVTDGQAQRLSHLIMEGQS